MPVALDDTCEINDETGGTVTIEVGGTLTGSVVYLDEFRSVTHVRVDLGDGDIRTLEVPYSLIPTP